ncbi:MAG: hypothetical protein COB23_07960 [Methylophaga sp.]|nr:MAG: hypothetical protein COB23_07960 [Methylophaga sp.]
MIVIQRILLTLFILPSLALADSSAIDKVYHPYVQPLEREIEWRMIAADDEQVHRLGLGKSFSDRLFIEAYLIAKDEKHGDFSLTAYELEAKWQLTEQGEYSADWGIIVELEKQKSINAWELAAGLLIEKEWGRWVGTANLWGIYEWGEDQDDEVESVLALQARYRYSRFIEPAIEFYSGENTRGLGPVLMGDIRMGRGKKLHWEVGAIIGLDSKTPDNTWRLLTEFEF